MIEFKILSTADKSQIATYLHLGSELTLGSSEGDMLIDDPQMSPLQLKISALGGQATVENLAPDVEVRLNGRAVEGPAAIKEKDSLSVGRTNIQLLRIDNLSQEIPAPFEHPQAAARFATGSREKALLDALAHLEKTAAGPTLASPPPVPPPLPGMKTPPPLPGKPPLPR